MVFVVRTRNSDSPGRPVIRNNQLVVLLLGLCLTVIFISMSGNARVTRFIDSDRRKGDERVLSIIPAEISWSGYDEVVGKNQINDNKPTAAFRQPTKTVKTETLKSQKRTGGKNHLNECGNSQRWLQGPRHGNLRQDPLLTDDLTKTLMLDLHKLLISEQRHSILGQTICHADGRFRNDTATSIALDDRTVRLWAVRLIYYAIHYHQHRLALPELSQRYHSDEQDSQCSPQSLFENYNVSMFDYECPDAKYIIMPLGGNGLGANVRGGMVPAYLMGLTSDRIVLFVNNAAEGKNDTFLTSPWLLASCPNRQDYQCFFMPPSPCTLTVEEIAAAHPLDRGAIGKLIRRSETVSKYYHHKVWSFSPNFNPTLFIGPRIISKLQEYAKLLVKAVPDTPENDLFRVLLQKAVESIGAEDSPREEQYNFAARWSKIHHALSMYSVRPSPSSAAALDKIMEEIIPDNLDPEISMGLPVRASDKCKHESDCLSFVDYMTVTTDLWSRHIDQTGIDKHPTVIFTTEDKSVMDGQKAWVDQNQSRFVYDFVLNRRDMLPGSGYIKDVVWQKHGMGMAADPDANMLSSISSLKAQLLPRLSIGNCCSNFHTLLNDFLLEGCGAASENTFTCLQEYDGDPMLRVCCSWHKECRANKKAKHAAWLANATTLKVQ